MKNKTLIFDLDSTLYYAGNQMEKLCYNKVMSFLIENMKVNKIQAMKLIKEFSQALHAKTLGFKHPTTGEWMQFDSELPADITALLEKWRKYNPSNILD